MKQLGLTVPWTSCLDPLSLKQQYIIMWNCWSLSLTTQNLNSGLISLSGVYVTHKLLEVYLKIGLEDDSPIPAMKPAPLGGSRGINTSFHLILAAGKGVRSGGIWAWLTTTCLCLPSLASGIDYHHIPATVTVYLSVLCATPDPDWRVRRLFLPFLSYLCNQSPFFTSLITIYTHIKQM